MGSSAIRPLLKAKSSYVFWGTGHESPPSNENHIRMNLYFAAFSVCKSNKTIQSAFFFLNSKDHHHQEIRIESSFFFFPPGFVPFFSSMNENSDVAEARRNLAIIQAITPTSPCTCRVSMPGFVCLGGSHRYLISFPPWVMAVPRSVFHL